MRNKIWFVIGLLMLFVMPGNVHAELPWQFDQHTRYMALGDSLTAGYGAIPATQGYVYLLYQSGTFDTVPDTILCNAGVPGATSLDVLEHQVPQAIERFRPTVITITIGGNDLLSILTGSDANQVIDAFKENLVQILTLLRTELPDTKIYISNLYAIPEIPASEIIVPYFNKVLEQAADNFGVPVADVYSAFQGREGLLLIERHGAAPDQVHPTNAGYRVMAEAFKSVIP